MGFHGNFKNRILCRAVFIGGLFVFTFAAAIPFSWSAPVTRHAAARKGAKADDCLEKFYRHKDKSCIKDFLKQIASPAVANKNGSISPWVIGFFASIFQSDPHEKAEVLKQNATPDMKLLFSAALYGAGLQDEAKTYAQAQGIPNALNDMEEHGLSTLQQAKPVSNPADNDFLIGAYAASGNIDYIKRILANFTGASDGMVRDSLRLSMMIGKFGPALAVPGRHPATMHTACQKYHCMEDKKDMMRVMTLASAFWAVRALAENDPAIKKAFAEFFGSDPRLKKILAEEDKAFANYTASLAALAAKKNDAATNNSLDVYEGLGVRQGEMKTIMKK